MSRPTSASGVAEVSAPLRRGVSPGAEVASGDGQLRHAQRAARASVAEEASSFCVPLCADQFKLVESGGALVSRIARERDSARQLRECAGSKAGDRGIYASLERKPQAVHLERHCRRDHQKDRSRAGQDGADQTRIHPAQREKEGRCSVKLYTGHTTRLVEVGESAGSTITLPAAVLRSTALTILGTGGMPSWDILTDAFQQVMNSVARGTLRIETESVPLAEIEEAWERDAHAHRLVVIP